MCLFLISSISGCSWLCQTMPLERVQYADLVLMGATGNSVAKGASRVGQCCCSNAPPTRQKAVNPPPAQLRQDSPTSITFILLVRATKEIIPTKCEVCALSFQT